MAALRADCIPALGADALGKARDCAATGTGGLSQHGRGNSRAHDGVRHIPARAGSLRATLRAAQSGANGLVLAAERQKRAA